MGKNWTRAVALGLSLCLAALGLCPAALAMSLGGARPPQSGGGTGGVYQVTLDAQTIGDGQSLAFETVAGELAGNPYAGDYYPGALTVTLAGPVVIEKGGVLSIGTLSVGNPKEESPVIRGELCPQGLIVVKAGGRLILKTARLDLTGQGLFLVQEPGGSVELVDTPVEEALVRWAPPTVDNTYRTPADLWLEEGTALTAALLPQTMTAPVQDRGNADTRELTLSWDLADYRGQTRGELALTGSFLDEAGAAMPSARPLTMTVRWVAPQRLIITKTSWLGDSAATAKLELKELPQEAKRTWGEVSRDGGGSWERWEPFQLRQGESGSFAVFSLPDATPRYFRIRAANEEGSKLWTSQGYRLPGGGTIASDQGGNRGGSTAVRRPSRVPASPSPEPPPSPTPTATPSVAPTATPSPTASAIPSVEPMPTATATPAAAPSVDPTPTVTAIPSGEPTPPVAPSVEAPPPATSSAKPTAVTVEPSGKPTPPATVEPSPPAAPSAEPTPPAATKPVPSGAPTPPPTAQPTPPPAPADRPLPAAVQGLLAAAGLGVCVALGVRFTRKRK